MRAFEFTDEWHLAADSLLVARTLRDVGQWARWWPSVESVVELAAEDGTGPERRFTFRTRLPYRVSFDVWLQRDDPDGTVVEGTVGGRVEGQGGWEVLPVDGTSVVRFAWVVRPQPLWMRVLSPLARPVFVWNHRALMREGGRAFARRLGVPLLAEPQSTPGVAASAAVPVLAVLAFAGAAAIVSRRTGSSSRRPGSHRSLRRKDAAASAHTIATHSAAHAR